MNFKSIRFRLTLWYSLVLFIAIGIIFSGFYLVTKRILFAQTDTTLSSHGEKVVEIVSRQTGDMNEAISKKSFVTEFSEIPGMVVIVLDKNGNIISSSFSTGIADEIFQKLFNLGKMESKPIYSNETLGNSHMRFYIAQIKSNDSFSGVVLVAHPIDVIQKSLSVLLYIMIASFIILVIPMVIGGYFISQQAMEPIREISKKLQFITSENLDEKISNPKTGDEIEELSDTFNNLLDRLHSAFQREKQFIGDLAHELKTPLATQQSGIEVTLSKKRNENEYQKALEEALVDSQRISETLKNILDLAWSETDKSKMNGDRVNLSGLMNEIKEIASKIAIRKEIMIEGSVEENINVFGKKDKLFRAILNLIDNAIKYTPKQGKVLISLQILKNTAVIKVNDTGIGISKNDLNHIFERFYRGAKTGQIAGVGLGLAIAKSIINAHKGKIKIESIVNKGTTITVSLPIQPPILF